MNDKHDRTTSILNELTQKLQHKKQLAKDSLLLSILAIIVSTIAFVIQGLMFFYYFAWFITPITGWHVPNVTTAMGLALAVGYLTQKVPYSSEVDEAVRKTVKDATDVDELAYAKAKIVLTNVFAQLFMYILAIAVGWVWYQLIIIYT